MAMAQSQSRVLMLCNISMVCMAIATNLPPVYLTTFGALFGGAGGLTSEQLGRIGSFVFAGYVFGLGVGMPLVGRFVPRTFLLLGNAFVAASLLAMSVVQSYWMLLAAVLCIGTGAGIIELITSPVVSSLAPTRRTSALNGLHGFYSAGSLGTILLCSLMLYAGVSWRIVCAVLAAVPAFCFAGFMGTSIASAPHEERSRVRDLLRQRFFVLGLLAIVLCGSAELGMVSWLPAYAERALGYTPWFAGLALMGFYIGMTTGRFGASHFAHRFDPITMLACCAAAATLLVAAGAFFPMPAAALGACVCSGFAVSCLWPTTLGLVAERYPRGGPTMFGILALIGNIGGIIMPWAIGIVADRRTLRMGIAVDGIAAVGLLIVLAFLVRQRRDLAAGIKD